jgi:hypothetical protein
MPVPPVASDRAVTEAFPRIRVPADRAITRAGQRVQPERREVTEPLPPVPPGERVLYAPPRRRRRSPFYFRPVAIVGALAVVASAFLPWVQLNFDASGLRIPFRFLFLGEGAALDLQTPLGRSAGLLLIGVGVVALLMAPVRVLSIPRRLLGLVALGVPVAFVLQVLFAAADFPVEDLFRQLGMGAYIAGAGGLLVAAG